MTIQYIYDFSITVIADRMSLHLGEGCGKRLSTIGLKMLMIGNFSYLSSGLDVKKRHFHVDLGRKNTVKNVKKNSD